MRVEKLLELRRALQERYAKTASSGSTSNTIRTTPNIEDIFLQKIRQAIEKNIDETEFGVHHLSKVANLSHTQVFRKLKALTGENPTLYIRKIRLQKAMVLLKTTDKNVSEIAYEVGFSDPNYFSRVFHKEFGVSPSAIRN